MFVLGQIVLEMLVVACGPLHYFKNIRVESGVFNVCAFLSV